MGRYDHEKNIDEGLSFIENINSLTDTKNALTYEHIKQLWVILVRNRVTEVEETKFLKWLVRYREETNSTKKVPQLRSLIKPVFTTILCSQALMDNYQNINYEIFKTFRTMFEYVNDAEKAIEITKVNNFKVLKYDAIVGHENLWTMLKNATNELVLSGVRTIINMIHLRLESESTEVRINIWTRYLTKSIDALLQVKDNPTLHGNILVMMKSFLIKYLPHSTS